MSSTKNKLLKSCKLKFTNRYELHEGVANVPVFVDKFIHSVKLGPVKVKGLYHFSGQLLLFSVFAAGTGACRAIAAEETLGEVLSYYLIAFAMLYLYFSVAAAVDVKGKQEILKTNLIDYLENNISVRIPQTKKEQARLNELEAEGGSKTQEAERDAAQAEKKQGGITDFASHKRRGAQKKLNKEEVKELEGLLREFVSYP